jgi:hypothetical protein
MRPGYDQFDLIDQLKNFESMKHDYLVNTENIGFDTFTRHEHSNNGKETVNYGAEMFLYGSANCSFEINNTMQTQMANKLGVPKTYWDKCLKEAPDLLKQNVTHWLLDKPKTMMVRTLGTTGRAYLSDRYARYDHFDVLEKVMPIMTKFDMEFRDSYITDDKLYLRATFPNIERNISPKQQKGDIVRLGLMISNSETGMGQLEAGPIIERLVCTNGMVVTDSRYAIKRKHLGSRLETIADREILREETIIQQDKAWLMTFEDHMNGLFNGTTFEEITDKIIGSQDSASVERTKPAVQEITKRYKFTERESEDIYEAFLRGDDRTKWGMTNAITNAAQKQGNADRSVEMESIGWNVMNMPNKQWESIAFAEAA